ncbi:MAG: hypothetical protein Q4F66_05980 [Clostridium sp.]|nr:hypothetical protein [Clostridium sp.]
MSNYDESENMDCSTTCSTWNSNCTCTPCSGPNITIGNNTLTQLPLLSRKIYSCYSYNTAQNMLALNQSFQLVPQNDVQFITGEEICIDNIQYSYNNIGVIDAFSFFYNGAVRDLNLGNPIGYCEYNVLGNLAQEEVLAALVQINNTFDLISDGATTLAEINAIALSAVNADILTTTALNTIAETQYPPDTRTPLENAVVLVSEALVQYAQAENVVAQTLDNIDTADLSAAALQEQTYINASAGLVSQAASIILNYSPAPPSNVVSLVQTALTDSSDAVALMNEAVANPTFNNLIPPLVKSSNAISAIIDAIAFLAISTPNEASLVTLLASMVIATNAMFYSNVGIESAYDAYVNSADPAQLQSYINTALTYFTTSTTFNADALEVIAVESSVAIYNMFESTQLRQRCCDSQGFNSLFLQTSPQFFICSLNITISGTIGNNPFTAYNNNPNALQLSSLGYNPEQISLSICSPCNTYFTIYETIDNTFSINSIIPSGNYDASTPNTINASIISSLCSNYEVSVLTREPIAAFVNTSIECSDNNNNNNI